MVIRRKGVDFGQVPEAMKKKYCSSVSIIVFMVMLLSFVLTSIVLVYWAYSMNKTPNPFIVDALLESLPRIGVVAAIQALSFLIAYLGFRAIFAEAPEKKNRVVQPKRQQNVPYQEQQPEDYMPDESGAYDEEGAYDQEPVDDGYGPGYNNGYDGVDEVPEEPIPDEDIDSTELAAILNGNVAVKDEQPEKEAETPKKPVITEEEQKSLDSLNHALSKSAIPEGCYSVGEFISGRVSLFKGEGGVWRVSRPDDDDPRMARGYHNVVEASKKFAALVVRIREVPSAED